MEKTRNTSRARLRSFALLLFLGCLSSGCGVAEWRVDVAAKYRDVVARQPAPASEASPVPQDLRLVLRVPRTLALRNGSEVGNHYTSFDLPEGLSKEELKRHKQRLHKEYGTSQLVWFDGFGDALEEALRRQLAGRFRRVEVSRALEGDAPTLTARAESDWGMTKRTRVSLALGAAGQGELLRVEEGGQKSTAPHLGWAIPVVVLTGGITGVGFAAAQYGLLKVGQSHVGVSAAYAIDNSARALAEALARRAVTGPPVAAAAPR